MDSKSEFYMCRVYKPLQDATIADYNSHLQNPDSFELYTQAKLSKTHMKELYMAY